jgi:hypothetical protein
LRVIPRRLPQSSAVGDSVKDEQNRDYRGYGEQCPHAPPRLCINGCRGRFVVHESRNWSAHLFATLMNSHASIIGAGPKDRLNDYRQVFVKSSKPKIRAGPMKLIHEFEEMTPEKRPQDPS